MRLIHFLTILTFSIFCAHTAASARFDPALAGTVVLQTDDLDQHFLGSGFVYQTGGRSVVVTNAHVVGDRNNVAIKLSDGRIVQGQVAARDSARDLALITSPTPLPAPLNKGGGLEIGQQVFALGAPLSSPFTLSQGIVSTLNVHLDATIPMRFIRHSAPINPGSSGGPLLDQTGAVIGMNSQIADGSRYFVGIAYAIPISVIEDWLAGKLPPVLDLNFSGRPITPKIAQALDLAGTSGLLIDDVMANGWAARNGLQAGDILIALNGQIIKTAGDFAFILDRRSLSQVTINLLRGATEISLKLDLPPSNEGLQAVYAASAEPRHTLTSSGVLFVDQTAVVSEVKPAGAAFHNGLSAGDEILAWNGNPVHNPADLATRVLTGPTVFLIRRDGRTLHIIFDSSLTYRLMRPLNGGNVIDPAVISF